MSSPVQTRRALPRLRRSESLATIISQGGPLPEEQVWAILDQLLSNLEQTHSQGKCHRSFSLNTIGVDSAGELEIASTESPLTISELIRLHAPLPSSLRHEFDLVVPGNLRDATIELSHAGFGADAKALDLFQIAVLVVKLMFDVDGEKFLASPCLQETLPQQFCGSLKRLLSVDAQSMVNAKQLRGQLPGAAVQVEDIATPQVDATDALPAPNALPPSPVESETPTQALDSPISTEIESIPAITQPSPANHEFSSTPRTFSEPIAGPRSMSSLITPVLILLALLVIGAIALVVFFAQGPFAR